MKFSSASHAIVKLEELRQTGQSIAGQSIAQKVDRYAKNCATTVCQRPGPPAVHRVKGRGSVPYCPRCGREWPVIEEYVPAGLFVQGRGGKAPARVETAVDAGFLLDLFRSTTGGSLFVQWVLVGSKTRREMAEDLAAVEPEAGWTLHKLRTAQEQGERWIESELRWRGLLDEGGIEHGATT